MNIIHKESFEDIRTIHDALYMYNTAFIDNPLPAPPECVHYPEEDAFIVRDEKNRTMGGAVFHWLNAPRRIFVDYFYMDPSLRGQNWGHKVFAELEKYARKTGAESISMGTHDFQAPGFYKKEGYTILKTTPLPTRKAPDNNYYNLYKKL